MEAMLIIQEHPKVQADFGALSETYKKLYELDRQAIETGDFAFVDAYREESFITIIGETFFFDCHFSRDRIVILKFVLADNIPTGPGGGVAARRPATSAVELVDVISNLLVPTALDLEQLEDDLPLPNLFGRDRDLAGFEAELEAGYAEWCLLLAEFAESYFLSDVERVSASDVDIPFTVDVEDYRLMAPLQVGQYSNRLPQPPLVAVGWERGLAPAPITITSDWGISNGDVLPEGELILTPLDSNCVQFTNDNSLQFGKLSEGISVETSKLDITEQETLEIELEYGTHFLGLMLDDDDPIAVIEIISHANDDSFITNYSFGHDFGIEITLEVSGGASVLSDLDSPTSSDLNVATLIVTQPDDRLTSTDLNASHSDNLYDMLPDAQGRGLLGEPSQRGAEIPALHLADALATDLTVMQSLADVPLAVGLLHELSHTSEYLLVDGSDATAALDVGGCQEYFADCVAPAAEVNDVPSAVSNTLSKTGVVTDQLRLSGRELSLTNLGDPLRTRAHADGGVWVKSKVKKCGDEQLLNDCVIFHGALFDPGNMVRH